MSKISNPIEHIFTMRVYYEDTDAGGVVYYANYLKFAERARTEWLREFGVSQRNLASSEGYLFMVRKVGLTLKKPCYLDDILTIKTVVTSTGTSSIHMEQHIYKEDQHVTEIHVEIVCVSQNLKPRRLPEFLI